MGYFFDKLANNVAVLAGPSLDRSRKAPDQEPAQRKAIMKRPEMTLVKMALPRVEVQREDASLGTIRLAVIWRDNMQLVSQAMKWSTKSNVTRLIL